MVASDKNRKKKIKHLREKHRCSNLTDNENKQFLDLTGVHPDSLRKESMKQTEYKKMKNMMSKRIIFGVACDDYGRK